MEAKLDIRRRGVLAKRGVVEAVPDSDPLLLDSQQLRDVLLDGDADVLLELVGLFALLAVDHQDVVEAARVQVAGWRVLEVRVARPLAGNLLQDVVNDADDLIAHVGGDVISSGIVQELDSGHITASLLSGSKTKSKI